MRQLNMLQAEGQIRTFNRLKMTTIEVFRDFVINRFQVDVVGTIEQKLAEIPRCACTTNVKMAIELLGEILIERDDERVRHDLVVYQMI